MATIFELIDAGDATGIRELLAREPGAAAATDDQGLSAFMRASYRGGDVFAAVREAAPPLGPFDRIVAGESDDLPAADDWTPDGFTPLHMAAFADNVEAARKLLEAGADPNAVATASFARVTPLGTCAFTGALGVAAVLLENGSDPRIGEDGEYTIEAEAIARGNEQFARLIRDHLVRSFVGNAHGDLEYVGRELERTPTLANCAWDWGDGDWEVPIGAAAHMGRRDIAALLIEHGARVDIFAAAMLDDVEIVRAMLPLYGEEPRGPHGIPLRAHAEAGKATRVLELLDAR